MLVGCVRKGVNFVSQQGVISGSTNRLCHQKSDLERQGVLLKDVVGFCQEGVPSSVSTGCVIEKSDL